MNRFLDQMFRDAELKAKQKVAIETSASESIQQTELLKELADRAEAAEKGSEEALGIARGANRIAISEGVQNSVSA